MTTASDIERLMLDLINAERARYGLDPVRLDLRLNESAEVHSEWMLAADVFSHTGQGGSSAGERMEDAAFDFSGSWGWAENIAYQSLRGAPGLEDDVEDLHEALMNSAGHRANILDPDMEAIGIGLEVGEFDGHEVLIVTQNFAYTDAALALDEGGGGADGLTGGDGPDRISGGTGDDTIRGNGGADLLDGQGGRDTVHGGAGDDEITGGGGGDWLHGDAGADFVRGGGGADHIEGGDGGDRLIGNDGDDAIWGQGGNDLLRGEAGADMLRGGAGSDRLLGAGKGDVLAGGAGDDRMTGGGGADVFAIDALAAGERDAILDFEDGADVIEIAGLTGSDAERLAMIEVLDDPRGALLRVEGHEIRLDGIDPAQVDLSDFAFV